MSNLLKFITISLIYFILMVFIGFLARDFLLDNSKPFPTWTYKSESKILNIFTSWDSGFFYDLATNSYPNSNKKVPKTEIIIPEQSFIKVFLGTAQLGNQKIQLPSENENQKITNLVVVQNDRTLASSLVLFQAYPGITYCTYKGKLNFDRDLKSFNEALKNPNSCGSEACSKAYFTYFDLDSEKILQQGFFEKQNQVQPNFTINNIKNLENIYSKDNLIQENGCKSVKEEAITYETGSDYKQKFSTFAFMPLYPLLVSTFSFGILDKVLVGIILSYGFFVISILLVYKLCFEITKNPSQSFLASLLFTAIPGSFYLLTFQDTSLFTFLGILTIYFYYKEKTWFGIISIFLLVLTNIYGIFILIPLIFINSKKSLFYGLFGVLAIILQTFFLYSKTEDLLIILNSRIPWYSPSTTFISGTINYLSNLELSKIIEILTPAILVFLMVLLEIKAKKLPKAKNLSNFSFILLFFGIILINGGFTGVLKYLPLISLPLIIYLAIFFKNKKVIYIILFLLVLLNLILFSLWTVSSRLVV